MMTDFLPELPDGYWWKFGPDYDWIVIDILPQKTLNGNYGLYIMKDFSYDELKWSWRKFRPVVKKVSRSSAVKKYVEPEETFPTEKSRLRVIALDLLDQLNHSKKLQELTRSHGRTR
jgi:hypothetical protein